MIKELGRHTKLGKRLSPFFFVISEGSENNSSAQRPRQMMGRRMPPVTATHMTELGVVEDLRVATVAHSRHHRAELKKTIKALRA
jgi:hypothetical protein